MTPRSLVIVLFASAILALVAQHPLEPASQLAAGLWHVADSNWSFDAALSATNTTSNLVFDSISSLLQQWGNTHYRNGHTFVPGTIPVGTLLYHGTTQQQIPSTPDWVATDPEHSYVFCTEAEGGRCWQPTLAVHRPLKVLYFDGTSGAKMYGALDAQDYLAFGEPEDSFNRTFKEWERAQSLCNWGEKYNLDGFVRMETDFEVIICDFSRGLTPVSFEPIVPGFPVPRSPTGPTWPSYPLHRYPEIRWLEAGQWHNHFPGETRFVLDLSNLISFYDTEMFPSLVKTRHNLERYDHRVRGLSGVEKQRLMDRLDKVLLGVPSRSGVDWRSIYRVVIHRYADRLEALQYMLNQTQQTTPLTSTTLSDVFEYTESMVSQYILYGVRPRPATEQRHSTSREWASPVFKKCATTHTKFLTGLHLGYSEKLMLQAVNGVLYEICRILIGMWAQGVELQNEMGFIDNQETRSLARQWSDEIDALIAWLDWSVMIKCRPSCTVEETCYLPTWPFLHPNGSFPFPDELTGGKNAQRLVDGRMSNSTAGEDRNYWARPTPRCLRRIPPFEFPY